MKDDKYALIFAVSLFLVFTFSILEGKQPMIYGISGALGTLFFIVIISIGAYKNRRKTMKQHYILILGYKKTQDESTMSHKYPTYFTCYNGSEYGLQSGMHDALKFEDGEKAYEYLEVANEKFGNLYEFEAVIVNSLILGKYDYKYVIK